MFLQVSSSIARNMVSALQVRRVGWRDKCFIRWVVTSSIQDVYKRQQDELLTGQCPACYWSIEIRSRVWFWLWPSVHWNREVWCNTNIDVYKRQAYSSMPGIYCCLLAHPRWHLQPIAWSPPIAARHGPSWTVPSPRPVSYTHLDVYKRQSLVSIHL